MFCCFLRVVSAEDVLMCSETPGGVQTAVEKIVRFLSRYILEVTYKPWNAFFSASVKGKTVSTDD